MEDGMLRNILITGASGDIGQTLAKKLTEEGYIVSGTYFSDEESAKYLNKNFSSISMYKCDLSNPINVKSLFDELKKDNRLPDIVINNSGISVVGLIQDLSIEEWNRLWNVNVSSALFISQAAISHMINNKAGKIINISSVWGNVGASYEVAYSTTKGALNTFTKALAKELAPSNIQVNALSLGFIDTKMNAHLTDEDVNDIKEDIPAGRIGTCDDVFRAVLSIINAGEYMTGQIITMDGGWI